MNKEQFLGVIRHTLTFVGGLWVMRGIVDESLVTEIVGGLITTIGGIWSIVDKVKK
jgi:hypothetical protein